MERFVFDKERLIEDLAEALHDLWVTWSEQLVHEEKISDERRRRWQYCWVPYDDLTEAEKDIDRKFARNILNIILETPNYEKFAGD